MHDNFLDGTIVPLTKGRPSFGMDDKTGMVDGYCTIPWSELIITDDGKIWNCGCQGRVKTEIANILDIQTSAEFEDIFYNNRFKESILDGSYRYCMALKCPPLENNMLKASTHGFVSSKDELNRDNPKIIYLDVDKSCNLRCPSCRSEIIINKFNDQYDMTKRIMDQFERVIMPSFGGNFVIRTSGGGEAFASHATLPWLLNFDIVKHSNIKFLFHTNATLLHKHEDYLKKIANNIQGFHISIDAVTDETYKKTRINGKWNDLLAGLEITNTLKQINPYLKISHSFCISSLNYKEINDFINFSRSRYSDSVIFQRVEWWGQNPALWKEMNIFDTDHPLFAELLDEVRKFDFSRESVYHNLHYLKNSL
jgi:pyruvate-formate lyase-activating enzyme